MKLFSRVTDENQGRFTDGEGALKQIQPINGQFVGFWQPPGATGC
jgi:hypothetical protein